MLFSAMYTGLVLPLELHMFVGGCTHSGSEGWDPVACLSVCVLTVGVLSHGGGWGQWVYCGSRGWGQWVYSVVDGVSRCTQIGGGGVSGCTHSGGGQWVYSVVEGGVSGCTHSGSRGGWGQWVYSQW